MLRTGLVLAALVAVVVAAVPDRTKQEYFPKDGFYISSQLLSDVNRAGKLYDVNMWYDFSDYRAGAQKPWISPTFFFWDSSYWKFYLTPDSCLGSMGPLGYLGPLGASGPLSQIGGSGDWDNPMSNSAAWGPAYWSWFQSMAGWGPRNALDESGPLGAAGAVSQSAVYRDMYHLNSVFGANDFPINLDISGVWGALGPLSVLGPLGPLGALGPMGPHLLKTDANGQYLDATTGAVVTGLVHPFERSSGSSRVYDLVERFSADFAARRAEANDASFVADGVLAQAGTAMKIRFTSTHQQAITILVVPTNGTKHVDFQLDVARRSGATKAAKFYPIVRSVAPGYANFVVLRARLNDVFEVSFSAPEPATAFRLIVAGSGFLSSPAKGKPAADADEFSHLNIVGPHQGDFCKDTPAAC